MNEFELTPDLLESRNIASDCQRMSERIEAYRECEPVASPHLLVQRPAGPETTEHRVPEVAATDFSLEELRAAIGAHGGLIVRNMFPQSAVHTLIQAADQVIDACAETKAEVPRSAYHNPPDNLRSIMPNKARELVNTRSFHRNSGSAMCVEAPSVAEALLQLYGELGIKQLMAEYLGEPPCLTAKKWVLRRSKLPVAEAGWHQDGAFMGTNLNSLNMWLPLNTCGGATGAPGLDVVPRRLYDIASAEGAQFNWSVSDSMVTDRFAENQAVLSPEFNAGDVFFFDHLYLHRTQYRTDFTKVRYAVETWFFGATSFPKNQIPLAW